MVWFKNLVFGLAGGLYVCFYLLTSAVVHALTIIGIKKAYALVKCALYCIAPYGKAATADFASHKIGNALWMCTLGWQVGLLCMTFAVFWYLTYFGRGYGEKFYSLAQLAAAPFGAKLDFGGGSRLLRHYKFGAV